MTGEKGDNAIKFGNQRRRYVHPIQPVSNGSDFRARLNFELEAFGKEPSNPIVLGFFNESQSVSRQSLTLRIPSANEASISLSGRKREWTALSTLPLKRGAVYQLDITYKPQTGKLLANLSRGPGTPVICGLNGVVPRDGANFEFNESGAGMWDAEKAVDNTPSDSAYRCLLNRVEFEIVGSKQSAELKSP